MTNYWHIHGLVFDQDLLWVGQKGVVPSFMGTPATISQIIMTWGNACNGNYTVMHAPCLLNTHAASLPCIRITQSHIPWIAGIALSLHLNDLFGIWMIRMTICHAYFPSLSLSLFFFCCRHWGERVAWLRLWHPSGRNFWVSFPLLVLEILSLFSK